METLTSSVSIMILIRDNIQWNSRWKVLKLEDAANWELPLISEHVLEVYDYLNHEMIDFELAYFLILDLIRIIRTPY